ncbi:unnamed protein product [Sphagnum compactum]
MESHPLPRRHRRRSTVEKVTDAVKGAASAVKEKVVDVKNALVGQKPMLVVSIDEQKDAEKIKANLDKDALRAKRRVDKEAAQKGSQIDKECAIEKKKVDEAAAEITRVQLECKEKIEHIKEAERIVVDKEFRKIQHAKEKTADMITEVLGETNSEICAAKAQEMKAGEALKKKVSWTPEKKECSAGVVAVVVSPGTRDVKKPEKVELNESGEDYMKSVEDQMKPCGNLKKAGQDQRKPCENLKKAGEDQKRVDRDQEKVGEQLS